MPARSSVTEPQIAKALSEAGRSVTGAAKLLGVSRSTLHRRIRDNPDLMRTPENPIWNEALQRSYDLEDEAHATLYSPNVGAWSRLFRYVDWEEDSIYPEPKVLDEAESRTLFLELWDNQVKFIAKPTLAVRAARSLRPKRR